jgi:polysaccharide pyruvyl transferase WcaK-like protein
VIADLAEYIRRIGAAGYEVAVLVGANAYLAADDVAFVEALRADCIENIQIVAATSELEWLSAIAESALLVSGRFHHTLAAAFVDTPFVVMESNTPKIAGIMQMLRSSAFLSVHEASLSEALYERSSQRLLNAEEFNVPADVKAELRELARLNFRRATS